MTVIFIVSIVLIQTWLGFGAYTDLSMLFI